MKKEESWTKAIQEYQTWIFLLLILLILIAVRFYAADLNALDELAKESEEKALLQEIAVEINEQYSSYNETAKENLISKEYQKQIKSKEMKERIEQRTAEFKLSYKDPNGFQYLYVVDPYHHYLAAKNMDFDTLFPAIEYYFYKLWSYFDNSITLFGAVFYLPLVFMVILAIVLYFFVRDFSNDATALFATALFALHPFFLQYSMFGVSDTNVLNVLFLVLGSFIFLKIFEWKNKPTVIIGLVLLALVIYTFKLIWSGYYCLIALILTVLLLYAVLLLFNRLSSKLSKNYRIGAFVLLIVAALIVIKYGYTASLQYLPAGMIKYLHLTTQPFWPDAYTTVKELYSVGFSKLVEYAGGNLLTLISFLAFCWITWKAWTEKNKYFLFIFVWYVAFFVISLRALRFYPFFIPIFCITAGFGLYKIFCYTLSYLEKFLQIKKYFISIILLILIFILIYLPFSSGIKYAGNILPVVDDVVYDTAAQIKENSPKDARIGVWWDRGHIFNALAEREVHIKASPICLIHIGWQSFLQQQMKNLQQALCTC